jgi:ABC-type transporter Mla subunit MlaD
MRTPVRRIETIGGVVLLLGGVTLLVLFVFPGLISGRFLTHFRLQVRAADGLGVATGNKVMMQGIQIGQVSDLRLDESNQVLITCRIRPEHRDKITTGVRVVLVPGNLFESTLVRILPGPGKPLAAEIVLEAGAESSVFDRLGSLAETLEDTLVSVRERVKQMESSLDSLDKMLLAINSAEGSFGKLIYEMELHTRLSDLVAKAEGSFESFQALAGKLDGFLELLPEVKSDFQQSVASLRSAAMQLDRGMAHFPEAVSRTIDALAEGRRVIESLKRNILLRGNLPRDPVNAGTAPASYRDFLESE